MAQQLHVGFAGQTLISTVHLLYTNQVSNALCQGSIQFPQYHLLFLLSQQETSPRNEKNFVSGYIKRLWMRTWGNILGRNLCAYVKDIREGVRSPCVPLEHVKSCTYLGPAPSAAGEPFFLVETKRGTLRSLCVVYSFHHEIIMLLERACAVITR